MFTQYTERVACFCVCNHAIYLDDLRAAVPQLPNHINQGAQNMAQSDITKLLREHGLSMAEAKQIAAEITFKEEKRTARVRANDWDYLLRPLLKDIQAKASSQSRWQNDPIRAPVLIPYLALMRRVRDKIRHTQAANKDAKSIPDIAMEKNLNGRGMHWSDWVPRKVYDAFVLEFVKMNNHPDRPAKGKRAIPFSTQVERSANGRRWEILITNMLIEIEGRKGSPKDNYAEARSQAPLIDALNEALDIAHARELNAVAPVQWVHLLPKDRQDELARWRQATIDGMRDPVLLEAAVQDLIDRADARVAARREKEKARRDARKGAL